VGAPGAPVTVARSANPWPGSTRWGVAWVARVAAARLTVAILVPKPPPWEPLMATPAAVASWVVCTPGAPGAASTVGTPSVVVVKLMRQNSPTSSTGVGPTGVNRTSPVAGLMTDTV